MRIKAPEFDKNTIILCRGLYYKSGGLYTL